MQHSRAHTSTADQALSASGAGRLAHIETRKAIRPAAAICAAALFFVAFLFGCTTVREYQHHQFILTFRAVDSEDARPVACRNIHVRDESGRLMVVTRLSDSEFRAEHTYKITRKHEDVYPRNDELIKPIEFPQEFYIDIEADGYQPFRSIHMAQEFREYPGEGRWEWDGAFRLVRLERNAGPR